jgi:ELWxxDGT repeat protein
MFRLRSRTRGSRRRHVLLGAATVVALLAAAAPAWAATATLVKNINPGDADSHAQYMTNVAGTVFFAANDGTHGYELWKSNGTAAGTKLIKDIYPGSPDSNPQNLTNVAGKLFFSANTPGFGRELWKSDGTAAGTKLVKDINTDNSVSAGNSNPRYLTNVAGRLFFRACQKYCGLYTSDGTPAGTKVLKIIGLANLTNVAGTLFFQGCAQPNGCELWRSDGTTAGTKLVKDINPAPPPGWSSAPTFLTNVAGRLYFAANDGTHGFELWSSDGTEAGTTLVKDINTSSGNNGNSNPRYLTNVAGTLYFTANNGTEYVEGIWRSDGTEAGTTLVKNINPGCGGCGTISDLTNVAGTLFFAGDDGTHGWEPWKSDGTEAGTTLVKDINLGPEPGWEPDPNWLASVAGTLFFTANDGTHGYELWTSDGTGPGTTLVRDIKPGSATSDPGYLTNVGGTVYFEAYEPTNGRELWKAVP